ncbi:hypothetical protein LPTSP4_15870 [Leptospira ryugenii]|uniref:DUF420 domain-containing protein n=1 Tax=Leptospira ryugenii TaxID=1917863 RepID=A0A2P2DZR6_9LEPT|nr:DUF420 domain-containing protein [Leptospira ryugenii]GBF50066.1 hypothetical protein LPTSP4_15870 [Leptospira ryugenii]
MTLSILCFYFGYWFRKTRNDIHRKVNVLGVFLNLSAAVFLLAIKYLLGGLEEWGIYPSVPRLYIDIHRFFALLGLVLMLVMLVTGLKRKKQIHKKLHFIFLPLYTIVYISGLFLFQSSP